MDPITTGSGMGPEIYAMKKAVEIQSNIIGKLLESAVPPSSGEQVSGAAVTGIGQNLDIRG